MLAHVRSLIVIVAMALAPAWAGNDALAKFAKRNVDRYLSEQVPAEGIAIGSTTTIGIRFSNDDVGARYDGVKGILTADAMSLPIVFNEGCRSTGSFIGQNAFGVRSKVVTE